MTPLTDLAWLAGIVEGEGSIFLYGTKSHPEIKTAPFIKVSMVDRDIVDRCHQIAGFGTVYTSMLSTGKPIYTWRAQGRDHVPGLLMTLYSWMGERRRAQIREVLTGWQPYGYKPRSVRQQHRRRAVVMG